MERNLAYLLPENLYRVFNETDLDKRKVAIADLWDEDGIFIDPDGVHQGPEKISAVVTALQRQFPGSVFKVTSPIQEKLRRWTRFLGVWTARRSRHRQRHRRRQDEDGKLLTLYVFID
jgi:hypothetical protein